MDEITLFIIVSTNEMPNNGFDMNMMEMGDYEYEKKEIKKDESSIHLVLSNTELHL